MSRWGKHLCDPGEQAREICNHRGTTPAGAPQHTGGSRTPRGTSEGPGPHGGDRAPPGSHPSQERQASHGNLTHWHHTLQEEPRHSPTPSPTRRHHTLPTLQHPPRLHHRQTTQQRRNRPRPTTRTRWKRQHRQPQRSLQTMQPNNRCKTTTTTNTTRTRRNHRLHHITKHTSAGEALQRRSQHPARSTRDHPPAGRTPRGGAPPPGRQDSHPRPSEISLP